MMCSGCSEILGSVIKEKEANMSAISTEINNVGSGLKSEEQQKIDEYIEKYNRLLDKKNTVANSMAEMQISLEKNKSTRATERRLKT